MFNDNDNRSLLSWCQRDLAAAAAESAAWQEGGCKKE